MTGIDSLRAQAAARDISSPSTAQSLESLTSSGDEINSTITLLNSKLTNLELNVSILTYFKNIGLATSLHSVTVTVVYQT